MIFKSEGDESLEVLSIAFSRPYTYVLESEAKGAMDAARAAFVINDLLEFDIVLVFFIKKLRLRSWLDCCGALQLFEASCY